MCISSSSAFAVYEDRAFAINLKIKTAGISFAPEAAKRIVSA